MGLMTGNSSWVLLQIVVSCLSYCSYVFNSLVFICLCLLLGFMILSVYNWILEINEYLM